MHYDPLAQCGSLNNIDGVRKNTERLIHESMGSCRLQHRVPEEARRSTVVIIARTVQLVHQPRMRP